MRDSHDGRRMAFGKEGREVSAGASFSVYWLSMSCLMFTLGIGPSSLALAQTNYIYDANGRLVGVTSASTQSVRYVYDDNGNRVRTDNMPATQLALFSFSPEHGAPGSSVTLSGQGFGSTTNANVVQFHGVVASVLSSTPSTLQVIVPSGTSSGPISITSGGAEVVSDMPFAIDDTGLPPTLSSISPSLGAPGTVVTIVGQHLDPVPGATTVTLNGVSVVPTTVTDSTIIFATPKNFGGGRFHVSTPYGQAEAPSDYATITPDYISGYAVSLTRMAIDGEAISVSSTSSSDVTEILFDAEAGDWLSLQTDGIISSQSPAVQLYDPYGNYRRQDGVPTASYPSLHFLQIPFSGTYTLAVSPMEASSFSVSLERDRQLVKGQDLTFSTTREGESKRLLFDAVEGDALGIGLVNPQTSSSGAAIISRLYDQNGQILADKNCFPNESIGSCDLNAPGFQRDPNVASIPPAGWRQLILTSESGSTSSSNVLVTQDVAQSIHENTSNIISLSAIGQNGDQLFDGVAGQYLSLFPANVQTTPSGENVTYSVYDPDGFLVTSSDIYIGTSINFPRLNKTGKYRVYLDPDNGVPASISDKLLQDSYVGAVVNGGAASVTSTVNGQNSYVSFQAVADQSYTVNVSCSVGVNYLDVHVVSPSGSTVGYGDCGQVIALSQLPEAGTYLVILRGDGPFSAGVSVAQP